MNADSALVLILGAFRAALELAGPILVASLIAGVLVGVAQTATQINEASISYIAKVGAMVLVLLAAGPVLASHAIAYTKASFEAVATVVH